MNKIVNIMGTPYEVSTKVPYESDPALKGRMGYCEVFSKRIVVADHSTIPQWEDQSEKALESAEKSSLRHEVIHAFFMESGLWGNSHDVTAWGCDEEMTDWIALQFPKMLKIFEDLDCAR